MSCRSRRTQAMASISSSSAIRAACSAYHAGSAASAARHGRRLLRGRCLPSSSKLSHASHGSVAQLGSLLAQCAHSHGSATHAKHLRSTGPVYECSLLQHWPQSRKY